MSGKRRQMKIVSGGQTGVDRAALDFAIRHGYEHGGWCPHDRRAEDGVIPQVYRLHETDLADYDERTERNVLDSDATLIVARETELSGGTAFTKTCAEQQGRPVIVVCEPEGVSQGAAALVKLNALPAKAWELLQDQSNGLPVWIRPPKVGVEFYSGFSRAKLYEGAGKGHFRSVSIREPGQTKGTRLFNLASILAFIEKCEQKHRRKESWLRLQPYVRFFLRTMEFIYWLIRNWSG